MTRSQLLVIVIIGGQLWWSFPFWQPAVVWNCYCIGCDWYGK